MISLEKLEKQNLKIKILHYLGAVSLLLQYWRILGNKLIKTLPNSIMKSKNIIFSILAGLLMALSSSCKKDETVAPPVIEPATTNNVKVISNQIWNSNFVALDSVSKTLTLSKNITNSQPIQVGDILVSSVGEGFLRKVKSLNVVNDKIQVQTDPAYLSEVIKEGTIKFDQVLTTQKIAKVQYHYAGVKLATNNKSSSRFPMEFNTVLYDADNNESTTNDQIKILGSFNCDWHITGLVDYGLLSGLKEVRFGFESNESADLQLVAGLQYNFEKKFSLATVYFTPFVVTVGVIPVVFTPQFEIIVGTSGYANASITSQIGQSLSFNAGIHWLPSSGWTPYQEFTKNLTFQPPQLNVNASAEVYIKPELVLKVLSVAGPYVNAKVYGRLDADVFQTPWWRFYGGVRMDAGAKANILDKILLEYTINDIIKYEIPLAQSIIPPVSLPVVSTNGITSITPTSATSGGNVTVDGGAAVTERGVVYAITQNPTTSDAKVIGGTGTGSFTSKITGLTAGAIYYVRAYAINKQGTAYGTQMNFTSAKEPSLATVTTTTATNVTSSGAISGGNVTSDGYAVVTERGIVYGTAQSPTIANTKIPNGTGTGSFSSSVTGLTPKTTYYVRAYATNSWGTVYGSQVSFTTGQEMSVATVVTAAATNVTSTGAIVAGNVVSDGNAAVTERGIVYGTVQGPTIANKKISNGTGIGSFSVNIGGLNSATTYYVRAYAMNSQGTAYGSQVSFTTNQLPVLATVTTANAINIASTGATLGGEVKTEGNVTISERGIVFSSSQNPTTANTRKVIGNGIGSFSSNITGLQSNTTYYVRAYAFTSLGIVYGMQISFSTLVPVTGTTSDVEGNVYKTVTIDTQVWLAENLKTTKYNDGASIPIVTNDANWRVNTSGAYCWYNNNAPQNKNTYGALYNWYAVNTGKLCPTGWHVPSKSEWTVLESFLNGYGGKLKEAGTAHWPAPNLDGTNATGFNALPGGSRYDGSFIDMGNSGHWWSSSIYSTTQPWKLSLIPNCGVFGFGSTDRASGSSVRCIKD